jgi:hypothetical protein
VATNGATDKDKANGVIKERTNGATDKGKANGVTEERTNGATARVKTNGAMAKAKDNGEPMVSRTRVSGETGKGKTKDKVRTKDSACPVVWVVSKDWATIFPSSVERRKRFEMVIRDV